MLSAPATVYRPRNPQSSPIIAGAWKSIWKPSFRSTRSGSKGGTGSGGPTFQKVITRYLECGDLHLGFARVKCRDCRHEYLLAFSRKRRYFCPSCL